MTGYQSHHWRIKPSLSIVRFKPHAIIGWTQLDGVFELSRLLFF
jgi:hypothetical protein